MKNEKFQPLVGRTRRTAVAALLWASAVLPGLAAVVPSPALDPDIPQRGIWSARPAPRWEEGRLIGNGHMMRGEAPRTISLTLPAVQGGRPPVQGRAQRLRHGSRQWSSISVCRRGVRKTGIEAAAASALDMPPGRREVCRTLNRSDNCVAASHGCANCFCRP